MSVVAGTPVIDSPSPGEHVATSTQTGTITARRCAESMVSCTTLRTASACAASAVVPEPEVPDVSVPDVWMSVSFEEHAAHAVTSAAVQTQASRARTMVMSDRGRPHPAPRADRAKSGRRRPVRSQARRRSQRVSYLQVSCAPSGNPTRSEAFMTERVQVGDLQVAKVLDDFVEAEALPGTGVDPGGLLGGRRQRHRRPRAAQPRAARQARRAAGADRRLAPATPGRRLDLAAYKAFLREIGYLVAEPADFAVATADVDAEIATHRRAAAGRAGAERALRAQRRQRALGLALRRALRHRRHPRGRAAPSAATATTRCAATRSSPARRDFLDEAAPLAAGWQPTRTATRVDGRRAARSPSTDGARPAWPTAGASSSATAATPARADGGPAASTTACTSRS